MAWWWRRRKEDKDLEPEYEPRILRDGIPQVVPPAVYRRLRQIKGSMLVGDKARVRALQQTLMQGGWEVPVKPSDCDAIESRLREHAAKAFD